MLGLRAACGAWPPPLPPATASAAQARLAHHGVQCSSTALQAARVREAHSGLPPPSCCASARELCTPPAGTGASSVSQCGNAVYYLDTSGQWVELTGLPGIKVRGGGQTCTRSGMAFTRSRMAVDLRSKCAALLKLEARQPCSPICCLLACNACTAVYVYCCHTGRQHYLQDRVTAAHVPRPLFRRSSLVQPMRPHVSRGWAGGSAAGWRIRQRCALLP